VLYDLAKKTVKKTELEKPDLSDFDDEGVFFHHTFLPNLYKKLGEHRCPVFLLDEFDALDIQDKLPDTAAARSLFPFLRRVMEKDSRPAFIFVIGRQPDDLSVDIKSTFKASLNKEVWVLNKKDDAKKLILQAQDNNTLDFTGKAVERILEWTSCHPYLTQLLCFRIWEDAYNNDLDEVPEIDEAEVEKAVPNALEEGDNALEWLWSGLSLAEKIYATALAQLAKKGESINEDRVVDVLSSHAARLSIIETDLATQDLVKRRVLIRVEAGYRFAVELFRLWVHKRKSLDDIKDELDKTEPEADKRYVTGRAFSNLREWQNAIFYYRQALEINPRHFKARLYLGEAFLEKEEIDEAVKTLEQAYELDQNDSCSLMLRSLELQAGKRVKDKDKLAICERILNISPDNKFARNTKIDIWTKEGDNALLQDNLDAASICYQKANTPEKVDLVKILQKLVKSATDDQNQKWSDQWEKVTGLFEKLVNESDDDAAKTKWQERIELYQNKIADKLFGIGKGVFLQSQYETAIHLFREILKMKPDYFPAQLHLGKALLEHRKVEIDEAIYRLKQAYQSNQNEVYKPLAKALVAKAKLSESLGDEDEVLEICQQIRQIAPGEPAGKEVHNRIWTRRGDAFIKEENFDAASDAYQEAENNEQIERILRLSESEKKAQKYIKSKQWYQAALIYTELINLAFNEKSKATWQKARERCEEEIKLAENFNKGLRLMERMEWQKAQELFRKFVDEHANYQIDGVRVRELLNWTRKKNTPSGFRSPLQVISIKNVSNIELLCSTELRNIVGICFLNGNILTISSQEGVYMLDSRTLKQTGFTKTDNGLESSALSPDKKTFAFGMSNGTMELRQIKDGRLFHRLSIKHSEPVKNMAFSADGKTLASVGTGNSINLWELQNGSPENTIKEDSEELWDIAFSINGEILASASIDGTVRLWQVSDKTLLRTLTGHTGPVWKICFSPNGKVLASASSDKTVRLWQVHTGRLLSALKGHGRSVDCIAYSPDGTILASGSRDKTLRLWQTDDGALLHNISNFNGDVNSVAVAPDGTSIVSVSNQHLVQLWGVKK